MGWEGTEERVRQLLRAQKMLLDRLTPNKSAVAEIIGVWPSSVRSWCDSTKDKPNMPLAFVSLHPEAVRLLEAHAQQIGYTLRPIEEQAAGSGDVADEILSCLKDLGVVSDTVQAALRDALSPGRIDSVEALEILKNVRRLQQDVATMI